MAECPLCRLSRGLDRITKLYYEEAKIVIVKCKTCKLPMVVWKTHTAEVTPVQEHYVSLIIGREFPKGNYYTDGHMRTLPNHKHWHLRPLKSNKTAI